MSFEDLQIANSCESYILRKVPLLISAFPGFLVFGETICGQTYNKLKCLKFNFFDYSVLSDCISKCLEFVTEDKHQTERLAIIKKEVTYFWQGFSKTIDNNTEKNIRFIISSASHESEINFSLIEFNNLIFLLKRCLLSSLCLKDEEETFVLELIIKDAEFIMSCKNTPLIAYEFLEKYLSSRCMVLTKKASFIELLRYHNESFLVLKKLHQICVPEDSLTV